MKKVEESKQIAGGVEYTLRRAAVKLTSIRIRDGRVFVQASLQTPLAVIDAFVIKKRTWILTKCKEFFTKCDRFKDVFAYRTLLVDGVCYPITVEGAKRKLDFFEGRFILSQGAAESYVKTTNAIMRWYLNRAEAQLFDRAKRLARTLGLSIGALTLTNARGKWGSCDAKNSIRLNWRLMFLVQNVQDYVIIHELCHTQYHNHSRNFWDLVASLCPDYKSARRQLRECSVLIELYR